MRPTDLPTHFDLVLRRPRPHGTRLRYMAGCKCVPCRAANSRYESGRIEARKRGDWNGFVRAEKVRAHLAELTLMNARKIMRLHNELTKPVKPVIIAVTRGNQCRSSLGRFIQEANG